MRSAAAFAVLLVLTGGCRSSSSGAPPPAASASPATAVPNATPAPATPAPSPNASPAPTPAASPAPTPGPDEFRVTEAMRHVRVLSEEIGIRHAGTDGDRRAGEYAAGVLRGLGYEVELDAFALPQGGTSHNIVGRPPGLASGQRFLLVGGHIDSLNGPGANDNATGVGAVLDIARALRERPAALPVVVVAFGAEERQPTPKRDHHIGSRHFVAGMDAATRANLVAFLNIDMVGWGSTLYSCRMKDTDPEAGRRLLDHARRLRIPARDRVTPDWSDNGPFLRAGLNAGWLWTGDDPAYHSQRDTYPHVEAEWVDRAGRLALTVLRSYA
jgi:hypothetical protein